MSREVEFYTVAFKRKGTEFEYVTINVGEFFEKLSDIITDNPDCILRRIYDKDIIVSKFKEKSGTNAVVMPFGKKKNEKVYTVKKSDLEMINEDVFDVTSIAYDPYFGVLIKTVNQTGPSIKNIKDYLNTFIPNSFNYEIDFIPIFLNKDIQKIRSADMVRELEITLNLGSHINDYYIQNMSRGGSLGSQVRELVSSAKNKLKSQKMIIRLSVGRNRKESMDIESISSLLDDLKIDSEIITEIKAVYKDGRNPQPIDAYLKNSNKLLKDNFQIQENHISSEYLLNNCNEIFLRNRVYYNDYISKFDSDRIKVSDSIPELNTEWSPEVIYEE